MGVVALILISVALGWTTMTGGWSAFTGERPVIQRYWFESGRALKRFYENEPPARKAIIVDITGQSHRTADGSQPTKRDRSRPFPRLDYSEVPESEQLSAPDTAPVLSEPPAIPQAQQVPVIIQQSAPLMKGQIETAPLPQSVPALSIGRHVQNTLLADRSLSRSAQLSLNVTSSRNRVTLRGIVLDKEEKEYIGKMAEQIAGAGNVDNKMTVL